MQTNTVYTLHCLGLTLERFIALLQRFGINCVVDARHPNQSQPHNSVLSTQMAKELPLYGIAYMSFATHFAMLDSCAYNSRGGVNVRKALTLENVSAGLNRLKKGAESGYVIAVVDDTTSYTRSIRYTLVGQGMQSLGIEVLHIRHNGTVIAQQEVEHIIETENRQSKVSREAALSLGHDGEQIAALYLMQHGYRLLDINWNLYHGCELDIVAFKDNTLHFVEVKTRTSDKNGTPEQSIDYEKRRNLGEAMMLYRRRNQVMDKPYQLDSISVLYRSATDYDLRMFENLRW